jgi:hypothetical protein
MRLAAPGRDVIVTGGLLIAGISATLLFCLVRRGVRHITTLWAAYWLVVAAIAIANPLHLTPITWKVAAIVVVGVASFAILPLSRHSIGVVERASVVTDPVKFTVVAIVTSFALLIGLRLFEARIASSAGAAFGELDPSAVRYAQSIGTARGGGPGLLLLSLAPVVACLGVLGGKTLHRAWYTLVLLSLYVSTRQPGRTLTLGVIAAAIAFYLYVDASRPRKRRDARSGRVVILVLVTLIASVAYFQSVGNSLGKTKIVTSQLEKTWVPEGLAVPLVYEIGGLSALATVEKYDIDPAVGNHGRSTYILARTEKAVGARSETPDTVAAFTNIPIPFNVYTAFGDVWFDYGPVGLIGLFVFFGALVSAADRRAATGSYAWMWSAALLISVAASTPISFRLFNVDTIAVLVAGAVVFKFSQGQVESVWSPKAWAARKCTKVPSAKPTAA